MITRDMETVATVAEGKVVVIVVATAVAAIKIAESWRSGKIIPSR